MLKLLFAVLLPCGCLAAEIGAEQRATASTPAAKPFRVTFTVWDGEPARRDTLVFNIKMHDFRAPFCMPPLGAMIPQTKLRLERFEKKMRRAPDGAEVDASELTLLNIETGDSATLVLGQQQDVGAIAGMRRLR